jgi:prolyl-tRNA synthetase
MPVVVGDRVVLALVRGDDRLSDEKLMTIFESDFRPATNEEIRETFGANGGSIGPLGVSVEMIADEALREGQFVAGANRDGRHVRGVEAGRDYEPRFADIRQAVEGDSCPECGGRLSVEPAIEVGHIFKLGTFHSDAFDATYLDEDGTEKTIVMGSYGIGPARTMAAIVEQHHDENGILWPTEVAPYDVHVLSLDGGSEEVRACAEEVANALGEAGFDVLLDERDERPGEKFADADLVGIPLRVIVGRKTLEDESVDARTRDGSVDQRVALADVLKWVSDR